MDASILDGIYAHIIQRFRHFFADVHDGLGHVFRARGVSGFVPIGGGGGIAFRGVGVDDKHLGAFVIYFYCERFGT